MSSIKKVAVIGTGVIGTGWIIRCLAHNKIVYAFDKDLKLKNSLIKEIKRTWPFVKKLFKKNKLNLKNFINSSPDEKLFVSKPELERLSSRISLIASSSSATHILCNFKLLFCNLYRNLN